MYIAVGVLFGSITADESSESFFFQVVTQVVFVVFVGSWWFIGTSQDDLHVLTKSTAPLTCGTHTLFVLQPLCCAPARFRCDYQAVSRRCKATSGRWVRLGTQHCDSGVCIDQTCRQSTPTNKKEFCSKPTWNNQYIIQHNTSLYMCTGTKKFSSWDTSKSFYELMYPSC